jgi:hypothetical protein
MRKLTAVMMMCSTMAIVDGDKCIVNNSDDICQKGTMNIW